MNDISSPSTISMVLTGDRPPSKEDLSALKPRRSLYLNEFNEFYGQVLSGAGTALQCSSDRESKGAAP